MKKIYFLCLVMVALAIADLAFLRPASVRAQKTSTVRITRINLGFGYHRNVSVDGDVIGFSCDSGERNSACFVASVN